MKNHTSFSDFKTLILKQAYSSDFDNILEDFYLPALKQSTDYLRLTGYFSSNSLAVTARGIFGLIKNGGNMKLIVSPRLSEDDLNIILNSLPHADKIIEENLLKELDLIEDDFVRDHISALGWMILNNRLKIRVAIPINSEGVIIPFDEAERTGLFHQKVGILKDSKENVITFSGSVNETAFGWLANVEEFKVFRSWETAENPYVEIDISKFIRFWDNQSPKVRVMDIPQAVERKLIDISPKDIDNIDLDKYYQEKRPHKKLFDHQIKAVAEWVRNDKVGIFAMATGTGKTYAALGCIEETAKINTSLLIVISCPYQHLVQQWKREINLFGTAYDDLMIADSTNAKWRNQLVDYLIDISLGRKQKVIVITTHSTFPSNDFKNIICSYKNSSKLMLIADEVHGLGANESRHGLINEYDFRLGLSATPSRWLDIIGTDFIYSFFKKEVFRFDLREAINTINPATGNTYLVPYKYHLKFAFLDAEEIEDYIEITKRIARLSSKTDDKSISNLEALLFARANIIKDAGQKYEVLKEILNDLPKPIAGTIIYCSPQQIDEVMKIVNKWEITAHRLTMSEGTNPLKQYGGLSERDYLLKEFGQSKYQCLVAMKCLDEGIDVPPAKRAILLASSNNPREYIQRIGRVIRRFPGKNEAEIHDIIVLPDLRNIPLEYKKTIRNIIKKELHRYQEIAENAINNAEAFSLISGQLNMIME